MAAAQVSGVTFRDDPLEAAHVGAERLRDHDRAVGLLVVLEDRDRASGPPRARCRSACGGSAASPWARAGSGVSPRRAWKSLQFEQDEISRYASCPGSHTSMS